MLRNRMMISPCLHILGLGAVLPKTVNACEFMPSVRLSKGQSNQYERGEDTSSQSRPRCQLLRDQHYEGCHPPADDREDAHTADHMSEYVRPLVGVVERTAELGCTEDVRKAGDRQCDPYDRDGVREHVLNQQER